MTHPAKSIRHVDLPPDLLEEEPRLVAYKERCEARRGFTKALAGQMAAFGA